MDQAAEENSRSAETNQVGGEAAILEDPARNDTQDDSESDEEQDREGEQDGEGVQEEDNETNDEGDVDEDVPTENLDGDSQNQDSEGEVAEEIIRQPHKAEIPPGNNACPFANAPVEVVNQILRHLLRNEVLGTIDAIRSYRYCRENYDLHTAILRTCKFISNIGYQILYGENTFHVLYASGIHVDFMAQDQGVPVCALTRYDTWGAFSSSQTEWFSWAEWSSRTELCKVQKWKVTISAAKGYPRFPRTFGSFWDILIQNPPRSLEVGILLKGIETNVERYYAVEDIIAPMKLLRNVVSFKLGDADYFAVPELISQRNHLGMTFVSHFEGTNLEAETQELVQSRQPVDYPTKMIGPLIFYAQQFERCSIFREEMDVENFRRHGEVEYTAGCYGKWSRAGFSNPFRGKEIHPVENALLNAQQLLHNAVAFKCERALAIEYLEPQYNAIHKAASTIHEFIHQEKQPGGLFCPGWADWADEPDTAIMALIHLENYAKAFERHVPLEVAFQIRKQGRLFKNLYRADSREQAMEHLEDDLDREDYTRFLEGFKIAVDSMNLQFCAIRLGRAELFSKDVLPTGCNVNTEEPAWTYGDYIEWDEAEEDEGRN